MADFENQLLIENDELCSTLQQLSPEHRNRYLWENLNSPRVVDALLQVGVNLNLKDSNGATVLLKTHNIQVFKLLLEHGANPLDYDNKNNTVLHNRMDQSYLKLKLLFQSIGMAYFRLRKKYPNWPCYNSLIMNFINHKNVYGKTALFHCTNVNYGICLLEFGANLDVSDNNGRQCTLYKKLKIFQKNKQRFFNTIFEELMMVTNHPSRVYDWYYDEDEKKDFKMDDTLMVDDKKKIRDILLECLLKLNQKRINMPFHRATLFDVTSVTQAQSLLDRGANVNERTYCNRTPLHCNKNVDIIEFLLKNGADIDVKDAGGYTPLALCRFPLFWTKKMEILLNYGADVNCRNNENETPLHFIHNDEEIMLLLQHGANVNAKNNKGKPPLNHLMSLSSAYLLVEYGADITIQPYNNYFYSNLKEYKENKKIFFNTIEEELIMITNHPHRVMDWGLNYEDKEDFKEDFDNDDEIEKKKNLKEILSEVYLKLYPRKRHTSSEEETKRQKIK